MAQYIKQEVPDFLNTGEHKAYYRIKTRQNIDTQDLVERIEHMHHGLSRGTIINVIDELASRIAYELADGNTVTIDRLGTFSASIGLKEDAKTDSTDDIDAPHKTRDLCVTDVNFRASKQMIRAVDERCELHRNGESRLHKSPYSREERIRLALDFIDRSPMHAMRLADYATITGMSASSASRDLSAICSDPASGIDSIGRRGPTRMFVRRGSGIE